MYRYRNLLGALFALLTTLSLPAQAGLIWQSLAPFARPVPGATTHGLEGASASLINGKIYVTHGFSGATGDNAETNIYDIASNSWTYGGPTAPNAGVVRSELASGTVNGKHYAIGGRTLPNADVEEFDPVTSTWTLKAPMPTARGGLGAATWGGKIYAVGGRPGGSPGTSPALAVNEVYDPSTNTWATLAPMPTAVLDNYATLAHGGKIYVFGGDDGVTGVTGLTQVYDIATNAWGTATAMPTARANAMAGIINVGGVDMIAVFGGFDPLLGNLAVTELYDPLSDSWITGPNMLTPTSEMAAGITYDASGIYAIGEGIFGIAGPSVQRLVFVVPAPLGLSLLLLGLPLMTWRIQRQRKPTSAG